MNNIISTLFSTTLLYVCVNGGILRTEGVIGGPTEYTGAAGGWTGSASHTGAPGLSGIWPGMSGYGGSQGSWPGNAGDQVGYAGPTAVPQVLPDGSIADVPEVAAARAAHLAALHAAYSDPRAQDGDDGEYDAYKYGDYVYFQRDHHSNGPVGYSKGLGPLATTLENDAAWKAKQTVPSGNSYANAEATLNLLIAKNAAAAATPTHASGELVRPYSGPVATPQVLPTGYISDTVEVNNARLKHLQALAETDAAAAQWQQKNAWT